MFSRWLKRIFPVTLYGRAAAILLLPMLTVQLAVAVIFIQRHFEDVTRQMTNNLTGEISFILEELETRPFDEVVSRDAIRLGLVLRRWDSVPSGDARLWYDISGLTVVPTLYENLPGVRDVDLSSIRRAVVAIESAAGPITLSFPRARVSASNPHQLLVLMVFTGVFMTLVAFVFLRNQLRPIKLLARAAEAFGRGQVVSFRPRGAVEVRAAGHSFLAMRDRIERQIEQRTMMLSGVSHDLKTPLTRLQLGLEMIDGEDVSFLKEDVDTMARMLDAYLAYAKDATAEPFEAKNLVAEVAQLVERQAPRLSYIGPTTGPMIQVRPSQIQRAVENLISNALRYAENATVTVNLSLSQITIIVEDDGPGIPASKRAAALRPFVRLDAGRNQNRAGGVGLGLSIAMDAVQSHGGTLELSTSESLGGLKAQIVLPLAQAGQGGFGRPGRT